MKAASLLESVSKLEGLSAWGLKSGIGGLYIYFGPRRVQPESGEVIGSFMVWVRTSLRAVKDKKVLMECDFPTSEDARLLEGLIDAKAVSRAGVDLSNNSLRLLFEECLISVFPGPSSSGLPWLIFDDRDQPPNVMTVYADAIECVWVKSDPDTDQS